MFGDIDVERFIDDVFEFHSCNDQPLPDVLYVRPEQLYRNNQIVNNKIIVFGIELIFLFCLQ